MRKITQQLMMSESFQKWGNLAFVAGILAIAALGFIADGYIDNPNYNNLF